eukprot:jgi/Chlat1/9266/Chrsp99S08490
MFADALATSAKAVGQLVFSVLMPCLVLYVSQYYTASNLSSWVALPIAGLAHIVLGFLLGWVASQMLKLPDADSRMVTLSTAFNNSGAVPLVLIDAIVRNSARLSKESSASQSALAMVMVYSIPWLLIFLSIGIDIIRGTKDEKEVSTPTSSQLSSHPSQTILATALPTSPASSRGRSRVSDTHMVDIAINSVDSSASGAVLERLNAAESALPELANKSVEPVVLQQSPSKALRPLWLRAALRLLRILNTPTNIALAAALIIGLAAPIRKLFFPASAPLGWFMGGIGVLGNATIPLATLILAGRQAYSQQQHEFLHMIVAQMMAARAARKRRNEEQHATQEGMHLTPPSVRLTVVVCVLRLIIMPAISFPLTFLAQKKGLLGTPTNLLLELVILVQSAAPSSQLLISFYQLYGFEKQAARLSFIYLLQYVFGIASVTAAIVAALSFVH